MFNKTLSVEELNGYIHSIFLAEEMLLGITVFGEVSGCKVSGPHAYFTLKGESAAIACNLFSYKRTYLPRDGESVIVKGSPDYYVKTGKLSFNVTSVQPVGVGALHIELEKLKLRLKEEGVFDEAHKVAIPLYPKDVCVVTSKTGAVIRDIYRTVRNVNRSVNLHVFNVRVQGEGAEREIADAIAKVDGKYDIIIVARGGGSFEDLAPFNTEIIARAIYAAETPVISAVGHETDFSLSDLAADARAATPTAAAHMIAYNEEELKASVFALLSKMAMSMQSRIRAAEEIFSLRSHALLKAGDRLVEKNASRLEIRARSLSLAGKMFLAKKESRLEKALALYAAANPLNILQKGYFGVSKGSARITSVKDVVIGDELTLVAKDGAIEATVKEIKYEV